MTRFITRLKFAQPGCNPGYLGYPGYWVIRVSWVNWVVCLPGYLGYRVDVYLPAFARLISLRNISEISIFFDILSPRKQKFVRLASLGSILPHSARPYFDSLRSSQPGYNPVNFLLQPGCNLVIKNSNFNNQVVTWLALTWL